MSVKRKITKILTSFIILLLITIASVITIAVAIKGGKSGNETIVLTPGKKFNIKVATIFDSNDNVYCAEQGTHIKSGTYTCSIEHEVNDDILAYILNMPNERKKLHEYTRKNLKQNLIWRYLNVYSNSQDSNFIKNQGTNHSHTWPVSGRTMTEDETKDEWEKANTYAENQAKYSISISKMRIEGNQVKFTVDGKFDAYRLYINSNEFIGEFSSQNREKSIDISKFHGGNAQVRVEGVKKRKKASIYVLYKNDSQKLICISGTGEESVIFNSISNSIPINVDVSLQKYITKVNGIELKELKKEEIGTELTTRKNTYTSKEQNSSVSKTEESKMNKEKYKRSDVNVVNIEPGDTVTYKIHIYNNSNIIAQKVTVKDSLPKCVDKYSINGGNYIDNKNGYFEYQINNLAGDTEKYFEVTVHFNQYSTDVLTNTASIDTSQPNKTTYRTEDSDYVKMKEYKVSLEKFVSAINGTTSNSIDVSEYKNIITYLRNHKNETLESLLSNYTRNDSIANTISNYDLNQDGKVNKDDIDLYEKIKGKNVTEIETYIKADLNKDGKVDKNDLNIYKIKRANLNQDKQLNASDRYIFILKSLYDDNLINDDILNYLYVQRLLIQENKEIQDVKNEIDNYIKSDVNEDGYVTEDDNYQIIDNELTINNDKKYRIRITEKIDQLQNQSDIVSLKNNIDKLDINKDRTLNDEDINIFVEYKNKETEGSRYYEINKQNEKLNEFKKDFIDKTTIRIENSQYNEGYNINGDDKIDIEDYIAAEEYYQHNSTNDNAKLLNDIKKLVFQEGLEQTYDLNGDRVFDYEDYKILMEYIDLKTYDDSNKENKDYNITNIVDNEVILNLINQYSIYNENENKKNLDEGDINAIRVYKKVKVYNPDYDMNREDYKFAYTLYDINQDYLINYLDKELIEKSEKTNVKAIISDILNVNDINAFIELFIKAKDDNSFISNLNIDYTEIDNNKDSFIIFKEILNSTSEIVNDVLHNDYEISGIKYNDIKIQEIKTIDLLDINGDGIVDINDANYKGEGIQYIEDKKVIEEKILLNDIDKDGDWDQDDIELSKQILALNKNPNKEDIKNEIERLAKNQSTDANTSDREGHAEYLTRTNDGLKDRTENDKEWIQHNKDKYHNVVKVSQYDTVTYTIKVKNDGETNVYISEIKDYLPSGVNVSEINNSRIYDRNENVLICSNLSGILLFPEQSAFFTIRVRVTESNMSINVLQNIAEITQIKNKNGIDVQDSTPYNNEDSDYIQLRDITIAGTVWNDKAFDKGANDYNGKFDNGKEDKLNGIKVQLYRVGTGIVAEESTDNEGNYQFDINSIKKKVTNPDEQYVKASKVHSDNSYLSSSNYQRRWKEYYSYYIIFEYDGITYTNTIMGDINAENYQINSNAKEDNGPVKETRKSFNDRFSTINNQSGIEYTTKNEGGYIPQSNHKYNPNTMAIQSSTNLIQIANNNDLEKQLQHINLGLRGRDIFDLELTSDVYSTKVTVNGQSGEYNYNNNKVTVRRTELYSEPQDSDKYYYDNKPVAKQDAANIYSTESKYNDEEDTNSYVQKVRDTDISVEKANEKANEEGKYNSTGLGIEVTYKITVTNASQTQGTASKIINYFDNKYDLISVYALNENQRVDFTTEGNSQNFKNGNSNLYSIEYDNKKAVSNANSVLINTTGKRLNQGDTMDIYVVYRLKTPTSALASLLKGTKTIPTYNMAEIYEYKTYTTNNNEATRGLLDKDSAPGSVGTEKVRLITTESDGIQTTTGTPSIVEYYFNKQNLSNLKYEDDTYATPTLYFTSDANGRKLSGTVFEDYTVIYGDDRIKSGNGIQDAQNGEPGINGVTVELVEGNIVRYKVTTKTDEVTGEKGTYTFENFLPGNYTIRYSYGDTNETFIAKAPNTKSYNGEDFQSTNNTGKLGNKDKDQIATLNPTPNYWYVFNEKRGVSTAKDDTNQRNKVSDKVVGFTDLQMQVLNNARDGKQDATVTGYIDEESDKEVTVTSQEIMEDTKMFATTPNFTLSVEKTTGVDENKKPITNKTFNDDYTVTNMNFGIAEVPVTTIDLQKSIKTFTIMDSANQNTIAKITKDGQYSVTLNPNRITDNKKPVIIKGLSSILKISEKNIESDLEQKYDHVLVKDNVTDDEIKALRNWMNEYSISEGIKITHGWKVEAGNVTAPAGATKITAQIEDAKLQGARLEITYDIIASMYTEKNFDNSEPTVPNITGIINYIDNDLSYNETLGRNKDYWKLSNYTEASGKYASAKYECIRDDKKVTVIPKGTLDPKGTSYTTIVKAKEGNPLLLTDVGISEPVEITLEKTLSSQDSTIMDIITSSIDTYEYDNQLEITGLNYENTTSENGKIYRDRVRNPERYIILAGSQHDTFHSETLSIFPPTGENRSINYYIIAFISLGVLTIGIIVIKKFVIKRK